MRSLPVARARALRRFPDFLALHQVLLLTQFSKHMKKTAILVVVLVLLYALKEAGLLPVVIQALRDFLVAQLVPKQ